MCGNPNRAANENAQKQHVYRLWDRYHKGMINHSKQKLKGITHQLQKQNIFEGLAGKYGSMSRAQTRYNTIQRAVRGKADEIATKMMANSEYGKAVASNRTGKSIDRFRVLEAALEGKQMAKLSAALTDARDKMKTGMQMDHLKAKNAQLNSWVSQGAFTYTNPIAPAAPTMASGGGFGQVLSLVGTGLSIFGVSDSRLKRDIKKIGKSIDGHNIYKFKYLDEENQYIGVMAEEVYAKNPDAVGRMDNGYLGVDYSKIDVEFREVA